VYGGGGDYGYRFTLTTGPHVDLVYPPAGGAGTKAAYTLFGRNLPGGQPAGFNIQGKPIEKVTTQNALPDEPSVLQPRVLLDSSSSGIDGVTFAWNSPNGQANPVLVGFSPLPVTIEVEPNNTPPQAQKITVPAELAGQFQAKGDVDVFQFEAKS